MKKIIMFVFWLLLCNGCGVRVGDAYNYHVDPFKLDVVAITQSVVIAVSDDWVQYKSYVNTGEVITNSTTCENWFWGLYPECSGDGLRNYREYKRKQEHEILQKAFYELQDKVNKNGEEFVLTLSMKFDTFGSKQVWD